MGQDLAAARGAAERAADSISWDGMQRRHDIALGAEALAVAVGEGATAVGEGATAANGGAAGGTASAPADEQAAQRSQPRPAGSVARP
jgi:hypothetical protein